MKLANLQIDQFGARRQLSLQEFSTELNVIYGPNGAGKTTIIQFIRWMLFGQHDDVSEPFLIAGERSGGSMTILETAGPRSFQRTHRSRGISDVVHPDTLEPVLPPSAGVSVHEFDRFFNVSFDRSHELADLLSAARTHGFRLEYQQEQLERFQQLMEQIDRYRDELNRLPVGDDGSLESLRRRRDEMRHELDAIRLDSQRSREELRRRREPLAAEVFDQHALVERLNGIVNKINAAIARRREQLIEEHQRWLATRGEEADRRHHGVTELDGQIASWREILDEVRKRLDYLRGQIASLGKDPDLLPDAPGMPRFLRALGVRIQDIQHDLGGVYGVDAGRDHESDANYLRDLFDSAIHSLKDDISRLYQTVERQQQAIELHEYREELKYLSRCESELSDLIEALTGRRDGLAREFAPQGNAPCANAADYWLADPQFTITPEVAASLNDFRLRHLITRREEATSRQNKAKVEFAKRQRELRAVEEELERAIEDGRSAYLQREIDGIDLMLRQAHQRQSLQQTITSLEAEVRRLRAELEQSRSLDEAAAIFAHLTGREYTTIGVTASGRCDVTHRDGHIYHDTQLSRGLRDRLYLSVCLAIVSGYRRRQIELPLILNDVFISSDLLGERALARFLADLARGGQQVLVFTRHEHILETFKELSVRCFTLPHADRYQLGSPAVTTTSSPSRHSPAAVTYASTQAAGAPLVSELPPPAPEPTYRWSTQRHHDPSPPAQPAPPPPAAQPLVEPPRRDDVDPPSVESGLQLVSRLEDVPTLDPELIDYVHELGVYRVDAFLELDLDRVESQLGSFGITAEIIQRRQREILMMLYVAVTPLEAQLLVACGVPDPERLSRADEGVLLRRIETILASPEVASRFGTADQYSAQRIRGWIQSARASAHRGPAPPSLLSDASQSPSPTRATRKRPGRGTSKPADSASSETAPIRDTVRLRPGHELRFYLDPHDPVVDAPSIGPKTAERLHRVDIHLVGDLLQADPNDVAARLNDRRMTAETILQWQLQAQLVCRIPNLRSHDAQILVACGVEDPAKLATLDASSFLPQVTRFVETKEGQRILRNAKRPDLAEVTAWVQWSQNARQLKAA